MTSRRVWRFIQRFLRYDCEIISPVLFRQHSLFHAAFADIIADVKRTVNLFEGAETHILAGKSDYILVQKPFDMRIRPNVREF